MADAPHPPMPGRFTQPNFLAIEEALGQVSFPIEKRALMNEVDGKTVLVNGQNVDLRELVKDLNDDFFDSIDEFHGALEVAFKETFDTEVGDENAPAQRPSEWNDLDFGQQRGAADWPSYMSVHTAESGDDA